MIREITITPVLNGFVCKVGCQKVVFESVSEMARNLEAYYKNPEETEKRFIKEAVNKMNDGPCVAEAPRVQEESCGEPACDTISNTRNPVLREARR
jgi:hypothetical protein